MARPTRIKIDTQALLHNLTCIKRQAPRQAVIAMIKANAYGCGILEAARTLEPHVEGFGVACIEEALVIRQAGIQKRCVLFGGVFTPDEYPLLAKYRLDCVIHQPYQLTWLCQTPLANPIKVWIKLDTGMHRLGFAPTEVSAILHALKSCGWVDKDITVMSHFGCADEHTRAVNQAQIDLFEKTTGVLAPVTKSMANSAAIFRLPQAHFDIIRPGIALYGASPFADISASELGLKPVMHLTSRISAIKSYAKGEKIGYGGRWQTPRPSQIALVPIGYGDGYPRHIQPNTPVWVNNKALPIVGTISMDMLTIDITEHPSVAVGDEVELWGAHISIERVAKAAGTIAYELLCQFVPRVNVV